MSDHLCVSPDTYRSLLASASYVKVDEYVVEVEVEDLSQFLLTCKVGDHLIRFPQRNNPTIRLNPQGEATLVSDRLTLHRLSLLQNVVVSHLPQVSSAPLFDPRGQQIVVKEGVKPITKYLRKWLQNYGLTDGQDLEILRLNPIPRNLIEVAGLVVWVVDSRSLLQVTRRTNSLPTLFIRDGTIGETLGSITQILRV